MTEIYQKGKYPFTGVGDTEEEAEQNYQEQVDRYKEQLKLAEYIDREYYCKVIGCHSSDCLLVELGVNLSSSSGASEVIFRFGSDELLSFRLHNGFVVWRDVVPDNYHVRSMLWAFCDPDLNMGPTNPEYQYRVDLLKSITGFWV